MNGISPLWQHARHIEIHRSGLVRKRGGHGSAGNDSVIASILGIIGVTGVVTRFRSFETFEDQAYSAYAHSIRMGRRAQLPIPVTTKARVKSFPRRIRCRIFVSSRSPIPKEAQQRIIIAKLPEMERTLVALIRECRKRHLIVTPDALLRVARETVPDEIPNIGTILELLGALELKGVIERDAGILKLSSRVG